MATKEEAKKLAGNTLATKSVLLQTEYLGTRRTKVNISGYRLGTFLALYGEVKEVSAIISKAGIATRDFVLQVTLTLKSFGEMPNVLVCWERTMPVVVKGRRPYRRLCGAVLHMAKV